MNGDAPFFGAFTPLKRLAKVGGNAPFYASMEELDEFVMAKALDWRSFHYGFNIPIEMQQSLYDHLGGKLDIGEARPIILHINGKDYPCSLTNSGFSREKFGDHETEIVRIMYTKGSGVPNALQNQVAGERIGASYDTDVVEAHHIGYFVETVNNDASNIVILSPNFHRIIHKANPRFDWQKLAFEFPNGIIEPLRLNLHLQKRSISKIS